MRPNLSLTNITSTLAVLGTSAMLLACGGGDKPAAAPAGATDVTASPTKAGQGSCSANGCGANATGGGAKPADGVAGGTGATATGTPATTATTTTPVAAAPPPDTKTATATTATAAPKPPPPKPAATTKPTGQASCGAGTCGADPKKK